MLDSSLPFKQPKCRINITELKLSQRASLWDIEWGRKDEIILNVSGLALLPGEAEGCSLVAFWRLANDFETNWHIGRRRIGGNWGIAKLDSPIVAAGLWDFLIGGIECNKEYEGEIAIVLLLYPNAILDQNANEWIKDKNGWGYEDIPSGFIGASSIRTLSLKGSPIRDPGSS